MVNQSKCVIIAKLAGREAQNIINNTRVELSLRREKVKGWRRGPNKTFLAFQWVSSSKYLGVMISYGHFELQTLHFRIGEAKQKLHLVRQFVFNRTVANTKARLKIWMSTVHSTLMTGLSDTGLSDESAKHLRSWYAYKIRSVLNMPAHVSRISTADLCKLHDIQDPVQAVLSKMRKHLRNLLRKTTRAPDITTSPQVVQVLRDKIHQIGTLPEPEGEPVLSHACQDVGRPLRRSAVCICTAHASTPTA